MNWKLLKVFGIILGILSIVISLAVFSGSVGYYESALKYGGDAYTGIQNAAAQTANNIKYLGETLQIGLAGLLLVQGLAMFLGALWHPAQEDGCQGCRRSRRGPCGSRNARPHGSCGSRSSPAHRLDLPQLQPRQRCRFPLLPELRRPQALIQTT